MTAMPSSYQDVVSQRDELLKMLKALIAATDLHYTSIETRNAARALVAKLDTI